MVLDLNSLKNALAAIRRTAQAHQSAGSAPALSPSQKEAIRAGLIQHFEFTYELCWKFMKRWLEQEIGSAEVDGVPRRELFRLAAEHRLIADAAEWFEYHAARNKTVHTYDEDVAAEVVEVALKFVAGAEAFLAELERRNA